MSSVHPDDAIQDPVTNASKDTESTTKTEEAESTLLGEADFLCPVVGIGASAGGLEAFQQLLPALPIDTGMAFVFIQHLTPSVPSALVEILGRATKMPVAEVSGDQSIEPNSVYVIPPGQDIFIAKGKFRLTPRDLNARHLPVNRFFQSLATELKERAIGVVLSGTASDGTMGLEAINAEGGITFAQNSTAQQEGMPKCAIATGCVDFVLSPVEIAGEIARIAKHPQAPAAVAQSAPAQKSTAGLREFVELVNDHVGTDFSDYKSSTLLRRLTRRMLLSKTEGLDQYLNLIKEDPHERNALVRDFLIGVTCFFRDPACFDALKTEVFPSLVKNLQGRESVRIWSVGCSTGEEAYSLAIAFSEFATAAGLQIPIKLFATDMNEKGIQHARTGLYPKSISQEVSAERLERFFVEVDGNYRIAKSIRDFCIFSKHNVVSDPPYSGLDLITCRNVLIYMEPVLQKRVLTLLHYALKPSGYLLLGGSETTGVASELFETKELSHKIFLRNESVRPRSQLFSLRKFDPTRGVSSSTPQVFTAKTGDIDREADRLLAVRYAPPGVLISSDYEILKYRGDTQPYLAPSPGKASLNLMKMLREGLLVGTRAALIQSANSEVTVRTEGLRLKNDDGYRKVTIEVIPLKVNGSSGNFFLVVFEDAKETGLAAHERAQSSDTSNSTSGSHALDSNAAGEEPTELVIERLTQELIATREYLHSVIEQQEGVNDDLQSANEEAQSSNEEPQSTNEELETSKEEIQSSNEELATVNEELTTRLAELDRLNNDMKNLLASVEMPILILSDDFCVRLFTPSAGKLFNLIETDIGRSIKSIKLAFDLDDIEPLLTRVHEKFEVVQQEVRDAAGRWYLLRIHPYQKRGTVIDGVVVLLVDVNTIKDAQVYTESIVSTVRECLLVLNADLQVRTANRSYYKTFESTPKLTEGRPLFELLDGTWNRPELSRLLKDIGAHDTSFTDFEVTRAVPPDKKQILLLNARRLIEPIDRSPSVLVTIQDVTELRRVEQALLIADQRKNEFLAMLAHELRNPLSAINSARQLLSEKGMEDMHEWAKEVIERQVKNLSRMIEDLLDISRITQGKIGLRLEQINIAIILEHAVETSRHLLDETKNQLQISIDPKPMLIKADRVRLEQIFSNLITNSAKFTNKGGHIWVTAKPDGGDCVVTVKDDGAGMTPEMLIQAFDLFTQAGDSLHRSRGGLGIGLTLVKKLTELHHGSIQALSDGLGKGSEFIVRLPMMVPVPGVASPGQTPPEIVAGSNRDVLLVEDSVDTAIGLAKILEKSNYRVTMAHDGLVGLNLALERHFPFVILDIGLPTLNGYQIAQEIRKRGESKDSIIIATTGYGRKEDIERTKESGMNYHLMKPVEFRSLLALLETNALPKT